MKVVQVLGAAPALALALTCSLHSHIMRDRILYHSHRRTPIPAAAMTVQQKQEPLLHTPSVLRTQLKAAAACVLLVAVLLVPLAGALYAAWLYCAKLLIAAVVTAELGFAVYYCCVLVRDFNRQPELHEPDNYDAQSVIDSFLRHIERVEDIKK